MMEAWRPISRPQVILVPTAMYHTNGFATFFPFLAGDHVVLMEKFDARQFLDLVERHRITHFTATPTMLKRIADVPDVAKRDLSSIVWLIQGAAPMPPYLVHRWADLVGAERILMTYGMSESLGLAAVRGDEWMQRPGTVGRPLRDTEVRILRLDGREASAGEVGEIFLRSAGNTGARYLGNVPPVRSTPDGFGTVGDMGYVDNDGYLYIVDRRVDMIVSGGANVFPAEVEAALAEHPAVADVVVVGLKDEEWGRRVHAIVEPHDKGKPPTVNELREYARIRLAAYKVPKTFEVVEVIPRTEATKISRQALVDARGG